MIRTTATDPAVVEEWAERLQAVDLATDYPLITEDGYSGWLEQSETEQDRYRGLARMAFAAGLRPDARAETFNAAASLIEREVGAIWPPGEFLAVNQATEYAAEVLRRAAREAELATDAPTPTAPPLEVPADNTGPCIGCGEPTAQTWRDADGEGWYRHASGPCARPTPTLATEAAHAATCDAYEAGRGDGQDGCVWRGVAERAWDAGYSNAVANHKARPGFCSWIRAQNPYRVTGGEGA